LGSTRSAYPQETLINPDPLGRRVRVFLSGLDAGVDVCCKVFYLEDG
jgi:hypothetical protein